MPTSYLKDIDGFDSMKRLILIMFSVVFVICILANLFFKLTVDSTMFETLGWLIAASLTSVAAEKFSKRNNNINVNPESTDQNQIPTGPSGPGGS